MRKIIPNNKKKILLLLVLLLSCISYAGSPDKKKISYGLTFQSHTVNQDQRTSLDLNPDGELDMATGYSLQFKLRLEQAVLTYGYIFRFVVNDTLSLDFISNLNLGKMNFVMSDSQGILSNMQFSELNDKELNQWLDIKVTFNRQNIRCQINNVVKEIPFTFNSYKHTQILFGTNTHQTFYTTDVPPISVRDIVITNDKGQVIREWPMLRHTDKGVYDEKGNNYATVKNGIWKVNKHVTWEKEASIPLTEVNAQITYDTIQPRIFVASSDFVITYDITNKTVSKVMNKKGNPFRNGGSQTIYDAKNNRLISYSVQYPDLVTYNFETNEWSAEERREDLAPVQQHNRILTDDELILFGGYGAHSYKATINKHKLDDGEWITKDLSSYVIPRYLSTMGYLGNDTLLVIGGYGSHSGRQEEFPTNLYDILEINYKDMTSKMIGQFSVGPTPLVFSNSMVLRKEEHKAYTIAYNNSKFHSTAILSVIDWKNGTFETLGDSIPYNFLDTESFCDLIYVEQTSTLYGVFLEKKEPEAGYSVEIYSLAFPPLKASDIEQIPAGGDSESIKYILLSVVVLLIITSVAISYQKLMKKKAAPMMTGTAEEEVNSSAEAEGQPATTKPQDKKPRISTIHLLGDFQVFDKEGNDITQEFTPIIKQVFLYILLNSIAKGRKVTSQELDETFWLGMNKADASNTRNVNIRKLRLILERTGDIAINYKGGYWSISIGDDITCDYHEISKILQEVPDKATVDIATLQRILKLASGGTLTPTISAEWLDSFKDEYTKQVTTFMLKMLETSDVKGNNKLILQIADVLLLNDTLDEEAMRIKCQILFRTGQKGASKRCYDTFVAEHTRLLNEKPAISYEDILSDLQ